MKREQVLPQVMADMAQRIANGAKEYGEPLTTNNGRHALQDAYEEALDLALYLKQSLMERAASTYPIVRIGKDKLEALPASESTAGGICPQPGCQCGGTLPMSWPGPDWSQAPEWAMWWAVDENGEVYWHKQSPSLKHDREWLQADGGCQYKQAKAFDYTGDWRESLRKRPK